MKRVLISILARVKGNVNANGTVAALTEIKKFFTTDGETRVYVSGRCVKYCIKQRLVEKGFSISSLARTEERGQRVLLPEGDPIKNIDDDLFGYLIPAEGRKRFAPIKTDGIVALRHCEITRDFGGRFDPAGKEMPSPFEIEVADFIGQNNWILTENIGRFEDKEITENIVKESPVKLEERSENGKKFYYLPPKVSNNANKKYGRENRLRAFLEVLLKERYIFPRSATSLHQPQYYYAVILLTERLLPLFAHVDYEIKNGKVILNLDKIENLGSFLDSNDENEKIMIVDFEGVLEGEIKTKLEKLKENKKEEFEKRRETLESIEVLSPYKIDRVMNEITNYLINT